MFKHAFFFLTLISFLFSCMKGQKVDLIIHNANIHVMDDAGSVHEAMAIRDGKVIEVGPERQILNKYRCEEEIDALGKDVYPGLSLIISKTLTSSVIPIFFKVFSMTMDKLIYI